jgi:hypothetical protein
LLLCVVPSPIEKFLLKTMRRQLQHSNRVDGSADLTSVLPENFDSFLNLDAEKLAPRGPTQVAMDASSQEADKGRVRQTE